MEVDIQYLLGKRVLYKFRPVTGVFPFRMTGSVFEYGPEEEKPGIVVGWCSEGKDNFQLIISFQDGIQRANPSDIMMEET